MLGEGRVSARHSGQWLKTSWEEEEEGRKALMDTVLPFLAAPWCASHPSPG